MAILQEYWRVLLLLIWLCLHINLSFSQQNSVTESSYFYQKVAFKNSHGFLPAIKIYDTVSVYGYVPGDSMTGMSKMRITKNITELKNLKKSKFISMDKVDTIRAYYSFNIFNNDTVNYRSAETNKSFIIRGSIVAGAFWLFDLYYSEILNHAGVQFTEKTKVLCVNPWQKKDVLHYRIVAIEENDDGQYEISYTYINYTNPLKPEIEKSGSAVITKEKFLDELKEQLKATSNVDVQNQCASPGLPRLVALPEKRFFYSLPCLDQHGKERAAEPMQLSLYVERLFYKYLYEK